MEVVIRVSQFVFVAATKPLLLMFGVRFYGQSPPLSNNIVAANHISMLDFILIPSAIGLWNIAQYKNIHTMTANKYLDLPVFGLCLKALGGFYAKESSKRKYGIDYSIEILERGNNLMIFPEGGLPVNGIPRRPKSGIEVITKHKQYSIIPIYIHKKTRFGYPLYSIVVGEKISSKNMSSIKLMQHIYGLVKFVPEKRR